MHYLQFRQPQVQAPTQNKKKQTHRQSNTLNHHFARTATVYAFNKLAYDGIQSLTQMCDGETIIAFSQCSTTISSDAYSAYSQITNILRVDTRHKFFTQKEQNCAAVEFYALFCSEHLLLPNEREKAKPQTITLLRH
jgi:uncharacterized membrane-anchored protein YhcB (DUF1043 family)